MVTHVQVFMQPSWLSLRITDIWLGVGYHTVVEAGWMLFQRGMFGCILSVRVKCSVPHELIAGDSNSSSLAWKTIELNKPQA